MHGQTFDVVGMMRQGQELIMSNPGEAAKKFGEVFARIHRNPHFEEVEDLVDKLTDQTRNARHPKDLEAALTCSKALVARLIVIVRKLPEHLQPGQYVPAPEEVDDAAVPEPFGLQRLEELPIDFLSDVPDLRNGESGVFQRVGELDKSALRPLRPGEELVLSPSERRIVNGRGQPADENDVTPHDDEDDTPTTNGGGEPPAVRSVRTKEQLLADTQRKAAERDRRSHAPGSASPPPAPAAKPPDIVPPAGNDNNLKATPSSPPPLPPRKSPSPTPPLRHVGPVTSGQPTLVPLEPEPAPAPKTPVPLPVSHSELVGELGPPPASPPPIVMAKPQHPKPVVIRQTRGEEGATKPDSAIAPTPPPESGAKAEPPQTDPEESAPTEPVVVAMPPAPPPVDHTAATEHGDPPMVVPGAVGLSAETTKEFDAELATASNNRWWWRAFGLIMILGVIIIMPAGVGLLWWGAKIENVAPATAVVPVSPDPEPVAAAPVPDPAPPLPAPDLPPPPAPPQAGGGTTVAEPKPAPAPAPVPRPKPAPPVPAPTNVVATEEYRVTGTIPCRGAGVQLFANRVMIPIQGTLYIVQGNFIPGEGGVCTYLSGPYAGKPVDSACLHGNASTCPPVERI